MDHQALLTLMLFQVVHCGQTGMLWGEQFWLFEMYVKPVPLFQGDLTA
jgi:hypothetical protein